MASDIRALERRIETRFQAAQGDTFGTQWRDEGYWLLLPVALLSPALVPARHDGGVGRSPSCLSLQAWPASAQERVVGSRICG